MEKVKTRNEYQRRIELALAFIDRNMDQPIHLEDVARVSHFSPFHFHRIFHALVGETVNDYIGRKRMEQAVRMVLYKPEMSISDVALSGGFSSSANFAKAFKLYFGLSPSELRKPLNNERSTDKNSKIGKLYSKYGKEFKPLNLYSQSVTQAGIFKPDELEELLMKIKVENIAERPIAYLSSPKGYELESVYETWEKLTQWANSKGLAEGWHNKLAICHDNPEITPEDKCRYDAAVVIEPQTVVGSSLNQGTIPGGEFAVAYYKGEAGKISSFMTELCSQWLANSDYEPDNYPPIFNYLNDSREDGYVEMNVYIKVKPLSIS